MTAEQQHDLFGGEPKAIYRKAKIASEPKGRQLDLIPCLNDEPGQMVLFDEPGIPEDLILKPESKCHAKEAQN